MSFEAELAVSRQGCLVYQFRRNAPQNINSSIETLVADVVLIETCSYSRAAPQHHSTWPRSLRLTVACICSLRKYYVALKACFLSRINTNQGDFVFVINKITTVTFACTSADEYQWKWYKATVYVWGHMHWMVMVVHTFTDLFTDKKNILWIM